MKSGFRLTRIKGIDIRIDWSLFIFATLITISLSGSYFPAALPGLNGTVYLAAALLTCLGLYLSILLHELAHSFTARKFGLKIDSIVLHLFGGVANLKEEPRRPRHAFWIAIAGPLASLALAGVFLLLSILTFVTIPAVATISGYLAIVNLLLGLFNLIPAYPLDGGQVARAAVWARTGDRLKATRWVSRSGRLFAWGFISLGFFLMLNGAIFNGLWLGFIGWFLLSASALGYVQEAARYSLKGLKVGQVMWQTAPHLRPEMKMSEVQPFFYGLEPGRWLPVVEQGYLVGAVNLLQLRKYPPAEWANLSLNEVMLRRGSMLAFRPQDDLQEAFEKMAAKPATLGAVIGEGGYYSGMIFAQDLGRYIEMQRSLVAQNTENLPARVESRAEGKPAENKPSSELDRVV
ncbi:MAG TPA: site-2 protease family protein [Chloroflexia bacterium]|nr:site-2 protease family protein [Chloroflexia bacterium]